MSGAAVNGPFPISASTRKRARRRWAEAILDPANGLKMFTAAIVLVYGVAPAIVYFTIVPTEVFLRLTQIATFGVAAMLLGARIPLADARFSPDAARIEIDWRLFVGLTWGFFALFLIVTFATAPSIPIVSAIRGANADVLSEQRGEFLKGRHGPELALLYISTLLVNTVVPYSVVLLYSAGHRLRHWFAGAFFFFSISFLQKSLFLNLVLPLLAFYARERKLRGTKATMIITASVLLLLVGVYVSFSASAAGDGIPSTPADVLTAQFAPASPLQYFMWRMFVVPIFTATDTLFVHLQSFDGRPLLGATSSLISSLFGMERINLERFVFEYQFGGWNDTANANSVFLVDGFVNFGWVGVLLFGLFVGQAFRWFRLSRDTAFASLWPLFAFVLFSAPLIGMMLSNGFLFMLFYALFMKCSPVRSSHGHVVRRRRSTQEPAT
jgi:hypothetical protein